LPFAPLLSLANVTALPRLHGFPHPRFPHQVFRDSTSHTDWPVCTTVGKSGHSSFGLKDFTRRPGLPGSAAELFSYGEYDPDSGNTPPASFPVLSRLVRPGDTEELPSALPFSPLRQCRSPRPRASPLSQKHLGPCARFLSFPLRLSFSPSDFRVAWRLSFLIGFRFPLAEGVRLVPKNFRIPLETKPTDTPVTNE